MPHGEGAPAVAAMPAMLRRRAARLGRMALEVLYQSHRTDTPVLYCSRHGELGRAVQLLRELATSGRISPQEFSVAVHNASAGLYSIGTHFLGNVQSIAGGEATPILGVLEACGMLAEGAEGVRLVICDEPLPADYARFADPLDSPYAVLLELAAGEHFRLDQGSGHRAARPGHLPAALAMLQLVISEAPPAPPYVESAGWRLRRSA